MTAIKTSKTIRSPSRHSHQGKWSWQRPRQVPDDVFAANWARAFGPRPADSAPEDADRKTKRPG